MFEDVAISGFGHLMVKLFSNDFHILNLSRDVGLDVVNSLDPVKNFFIKSAMGIAK